jgi:Pyridoxamine 5'-phosphate oxidase
MADPHPFDGVLQRVEQLREHYDAPMEAAVRKDIGRIDDLCRRLIAAAPIVFVATFSREGRCDVSPRGGPPGFVTVLDNMPIARRFVRSKLWDPSTWPDPAERPSSAEVSLAHQRNPDLTLEQVKQREREALLYRLD